MNAVPAEAADGVHFRMRSSMARSSRATLPPITCAMFPPNIFAHQSAVHLGNIDFAVVSLPYGDRAWHQNRRHSDPCRERFRHTPACIV